MAAFGTFVREGIRHIFEGLDHVLFVLCLAVGAHAFAVLLWCVTGFIGLIHGLGFSFVLQNILKVSSPNIWQSLLAFNIGASALLLP